jgi:toxin ParE1/3/4
VTVRYSRRATSDLIAIADYLTQHTSRGALSVEVSIRKTIDLVELFPGNGRMLQERPTVRVMPVGRYPYLVFTHHEMATC